MEDAESKNHEKDIQKPWERLVSEKQLVTEFTKGQLVPTSSGTVRGEVRTSTVFCFAFLACLGCTVQKEV